MDPLYRCTFAAQQLVIDHPPRPQDGNKRVDFGLSCPPGRPMQARSMSVSNKVAPDT